MVASGLNAVLEHVCNLVNTEETRRLSDRQLLHLYLEDRSQDAFAELLRRHQRMVWNVCRGALPCREDAEDAFQATFVVLARKSGSIRKYDSLASWLHGVAHRVALRARRDAARRQARDRQASAMAQPTQRVSEKTWSDVQAALSAEVERLPAKFKAPFVLCHLEGKSMAEAAEQLGWKAGTVSGRLTQARKLLEKGLARHGLSLATVLMTAAISHDAASAAIPAQAAEAAMRAAMLIAAGQGPAPAISAKAAVLAQGVLRTMLATKAKLTLIAVALGAALFGSALLGSGVLAGVTKAVVSGQSAVGSKDEPAREAVAELASLEYQQPAHFNGKVTGPDQKPLSGARVFVVPFHGDIKEAGPIRARTDSAGRFAFDAADMTYTALDNLPARREGLVIATADGYAPDWFHSWGHATGSGLRTHWDPVKGAALSLQLAKDDVPIRGRILDPEGRPLGGARVKVTRLQIPRGRDLGAYLDLVTKEHALLISIDYERELHRPHLLPGFIAEAQTDADGRFTLTGVGRERLAGLSVSAPGFVESHVTVMTRDAPDVDVFPIDGKATSVIHGADFTVKLRQGRTIAGVVRDRDTREPIAGMSVGLGRAKYPRDGVFSHRTVTDVNGRFKITGVDPSLPDWMTEKGKPYLVAESAPGLPYLSAGTLVEGETPALIECQRGIPFRLKLVDEQGKPVKAEVTYYDVLPNPHAPTGFNYPCYIPLSRAARNADGTYSGFVIPGPGAVFVETPDRRDYRPAHVDPKAFFAPRRTEWTNQEWISSYGTKDTLSISGGMAYQNHYAAIVLVNPPPGSKPLQLSATVVKDKPRKVSLVDPDGKPVVGAETRIAQGQLQPQQLTLRGSVLLLTGLHPDRVRRITFVREDRQLIGLLMEKGDAATPATIAMQPWATVTGRIVDANGKTLPIRTPDSAGKDPPVVSLYLDGNIRGLPDGGDFTDSGGSFRFSRLVPGQRYRVEIYFELTAVGEIVIENPVLRPGEVRDLGEIRIKAVVSGKSRTE
jgi:RNA polymerase sigma factor (sigma-70 family)